MPGKVAKVPTLYIRREKGLLTFGKARELAEMPRWAFHDLLGEEGIQRRYDMEELEDDLKTLKELG